MTIKMIRIYEVQIEAETPPEAIESTFYEEFARMKEEHALVGEYIYPEGEATEAVLREIGDLA